MQKVTLSLLLLFPLFLFAQTDAPITLSGNWELTRVENLDDSNRAFRSPPWVGVQFRFMEQGKLTLRNGTQAFQTTFTQDGQELVYDGVRFEIDRLFAEYWTLVFVDSIANLKCRLHFVSLEESATEGIKTVSNPNRLKFPLLTLVAQETKAADAPTPNAPVFKVVEEMPIFPGCEQHTVLQERRSCAQMELLKFVYKNVKYPPEARANKVEGTAVITFVVETDGSVSSSRIVRGLDMGCGEEALRVVNLMNEQGIRWQPGLQRGEPVRVQFNLPIKFKLD